MNEVSLQIRDALLTDAPRLVEIYSHYVEHTAVSFEYVTPTVEAFAARIEKFTKKYPYLVCEQDGRVIGYAYASAYSERAAYDWTAMTSIYVDKDCHGQGAGKSLYDALEKRLADQGIVNLLAGVAYREIEDETLTNDSMRFHEHIGYETVAHLKKVGKKFDTWYDLLWMQKVIRDR